VFGASGSQTELCIGVREPSCIGVIEPAIESCIGVFSQAPCIGVWKPSLRSGVLEPAPPCSGVPLPSP